MRTILSLLTLAALATACGYKGPLYLPKPKPEAQAPAPAAPAAKKEAKDG